MLHRDSSATFRKHGRGFFATYRFQAADAEKRWNARLGAEIARTQAETPVALWSDKARGRTWWLFQGAIYWEEEALEPTEVKALVLERITKRDRRLSRALAMMEQARALTSAEREPIPDDVKVFVWNRDGGRCVKCRSNERLEFDHVIPIAMGGANTARNLQLLCEACNRSKGASLV
jgi:hypothetical protein